MILIDRINLDNLQESINVFCRAMGFPEEISGGMIAEVKMFYDQNRFIGITARLEKNGPIIGFGSLIPMEHTAWIPYVGVEPGYQGKGIGKQLMLELIDIAEVNGWKSIELCASKEGYPLYEKLGFVDNYPTNWYNIKEAYEKPSKDVQTVLIKKQLPDWIYEYDKEVVKIDRSKIFEVHDYEQVTLIFHEMEGYALLYGNRIGPVIAENYNTARDLILKGVELGATSMILAEDSLEKKQLHKVLD
ncbi:MAG: GNAT family N-acetyltransferase, partial [Candidatus Kariarchaeaceae archaeon]